MTTETNLIAELAEVVAQIYSAASKDDDGLTIDAGLFASDFLRTHHATLTRIIESDATIRADYDALVIRLGEVTARLEAAGALLRDIKAWDVTRALQPTREETLFAIPHELRVRITVHLSENGHD